MNIRNSKSNQNHLVLYLSRIVILYVLFYVSTLVAGIFLSSYFGFKLTELVSITVVDGFCKPGIEGIGAHCFGDFYGFLDLDLGESWTSLATTYPPLAISYYLPFQFITHITGSRDLALYAHLCITFLSLTFPAAHLYFTKRIRSGFTVLALSIFLIGSGPAVFLIDRGNSLVLTIPILYLTFLYLIQGKESKLILCITLLSLVRPQFFIFALYFLIERRPLQFLKTLLLTMSSYFVLFFIFGPTQIFQNIFAWLRNLQGYNEYVPFPGLYPANWSLANLLAGVWASGKAALNGEVKNITQYAVDGKIVEVFSILIILFLLTKYALTKQGGDSFQTMLILLVAIILLPGVSFGYYIALISIPFTLVIYFLSNTQGINENEIAFKTEVNSLREILVLVGTPFKRFTLKMTLVTCFVIWPIPVMVLGIQRDLDTSTNSLVWPIGLAFLVVWFISLTTSRTSRRD